MNAIVSWVIAVTPPLASLKGKRLGLFLLGMVLIGLVIAGFMALPRRPPAPPCWQNGSGQPNLGTPHA